MNRDFDGRAMKEMYESGASLTEVGSRFGFTAGTVAVKLRAMGVEIRRAGPRGPRTPTSASPDPLAMKEMYEGGATLDEVGEKFGITGPTVARRLREVGVQIRKWGPRIRRRLAD